MSDEVRCPGCSHHLFDHGKDGCFEHSTVESEVLRLEITHRCDCTLTPAEIDALLAMRTPKPVPVFPPPIESTRVLWPMRERAGYASLAGKPADGDNDLAVTDGETRAASRHPVSAPLPAGDGKKPGPSCENCGDTGWVSTDVPGRAGPLVNVCPKNCAATLRRSAASVQQSDNEPRSLAPTFGDNDPCPLPHATLVDRLRAECEPPDGIPSYHVDSQGHAQLVAIFTDAADEIERLRTAISTTLANAPCVHLADDHGHQRCGALPTQHDRGCFRHPYTRPRMLDALAAVVEVAP